MPATLRKRPQKRERDTAIEDEDRENLSDEDHFDDPKPYQGSARKKRATPATKQNAAAAKGVSLFDVVTRYASGVGLAVKEWVKQYQENRAVATAKLMSFIVQVCGVEYEVTAEAVEEGEVDQLVQQLLKKATQDGLDDHFRMKGGKQFRDNVLALIERVVQESYSAGILFDDYGMDKLTNLIIALNCSVVRVFRLVATLTACQLVSCWIRVQVTLTEARDTAQRQLAAEQKKKQNKAVEERSQSFKRTVEQCHRRITYLKDMTSKIFQAVAAHRFRDISEEVRSVVIGGIGQWILLLPADFLQDQYLKYIAWALSDKDSLVRSAAASALLQLYGKPANISPLHEFTNRFTTRFLELIHDVDEGVAIKGLELLAVLVKSGELSWDSVPDVYHLIMDDSRDIRLAAARLVAETLQDLGKQHLEQVSSQMTSPGSQGRRGRRKSSDKSVAPSEAEAQLAGLVHMMYIMATQQFGATASAEAVGQLTDALGQQIVPLSNGVVEDMVDGLFDRVTVLHDWKLLVDILIKEDSRVEGLSSELASTHLMLLLRGAVSRAVHGTGQQEVKRRGRASASAAAASSDATRQEATLVMMKALPKLIKKHQADASKLVPLLSLTSEFQWDVYSLKNSTKQFEDLLQLLCDMMMKHAHEPLIQEAVHSLAHARHHAPDALRDRAVLLVDRLVDQLAGKLTKAVQALQGVSESDLSDAVSEVVAGGEEDEALFNVRILLVRLQKLALHCGETARKPAMATVVNIVMEDLASGCDYGPSIACLACMVSFLQLLWRVSECTDSASTLDADDINDISTNRAMLVTQLQAIAQTTKHSEVKDCIFRILTDVVLLLSTRKTEGTTLEPISFVPQEDLLIKMWELCEDILNRESASAGGGSDLDSDMDEEKDEEQQEETDPVLDAKVIAVAAIGRLLSFNAVPASSWLGHNVMSNYISHGNRVTQQIKELCKLLKKTHPDQLCELYVGAIKGAYDKCRVLGRNMEYEVLPLCTKIAQGYIGFSSCHSEVQRICSSLIQTARQKGLPDALNMIECVEPFVVRLLPQHATGLVKQLTEAFSSLHPDDTDRDWKSYFDLIESLKDRAEKGARPIGRSAMKGGRPQKAPRHIKFAPSPAPVPAADTIGPSQPQSLPTQAAGGGSGVSHDAHDTDTQADNEDGIEDADEEVEEGSAEEAAGDDAAGTQVTTEPNSLEQLPMFATQRVSGSFHAASSQGTGTAGESADDAEQEDDAEEEMEDGTGVIGGTGVMPTEEQLPADDTVGEKRGRPENEDEEDGGLDGGAGDDNDDVEPPRRARRRRRL